LISLKKLLSEIKRPKAPKTLVLTFQLLVLIFAISLFTRLLPARYGFYLNEFDPYSQYLATRYIMESVERRGLSGLFDYFSWIDQKAWVPEGRVYSRSAFAGLHFTGAILYMLTRSLLGLNIPLDHFLMVIAPFASSFIPVVLYMFVKELWRKRVALLSALIVGIMPPLVFRTNFGWFDTEPFAILATLTSLYLFAKAFKAEGRRERVLYSLIAGFSLGYAFTIWGGARYFIAVVGLMSATAPLFKKSARNMFEEALFITIPCIFVPLLFEKPGLGVLTDPAALFLYFGLASLAVAVFMGEEPISFKSQLLSWVFASLLILSLSGFGLFGGITMRYLTVLNPLARTGEPLVESVAEHQTSTYVDNFTFYSFLIFFAFIGGTILLKARTFESFILLLLCITSLYFSANFSRLHILSGIWVPVLAGVGIDGILTAIRNNTLVKAKAVMRNPLRHEALIFFGMLLTTLILVSGSTWVAAANSPVSLASCSIPAKETANDWIEALTWIRENTEEDAVIISWWDYGYWIRVISDRTVLIDNATLNTTKIELVATMFMSDQDTAVEIIDQLRNGRPTYVVVFVAVTYRFPQGGIFLLGGGGEESKFYWMAKIAGLNVNEYVDKELRPTAKFWEETLLGRMIPFSPTEVPIREGEHITAYLYTEKMEEGDRFRLVFKSSFKNYALVLIYKLQG